MQDRWTSDGARDAIARWGGAWGEGLALRIYTSRLIGADGALVLHGGGNTSYKGVARDLFGEEREALFVKGSGWDLADLQPAGMPAVDLVALRRLRALESLSDEDMVRAIRRGMWAPEGPLPSIETLLHAFLPHRYVDHSHADVILALTCNDAGERHVRRALGADVAIVPYVKPGFELAKLAAAALEAHPGARGLVLMKHGLFTFGDTAEESYRRHLELVREAETYLRDQGARSTLLPPSRGDTVPEARARAEQLAPVLRGALAEGGDGAPWKRWVLDFRCDPDVLDFLSHPLFMEMAGSGPLTPDHVIRTKRDPVIVTGFSEDAQATRLAVEDAVRAFRERYVATFEACAAAAGGVDRYVRLDDTPRVVLVPGVGLFGVGRTPQEAAIAADLYEHTARTRLVAAALGPWVGLTDLELFEMEYWSLEQAKLKSQGSSPPLRGQVALVTGGAGAIGLGLARRLLEVGACVALVDRDEEALEHAARLLGNPRHLLLAVADVTDAASLGEAFASAVRRWGGVDLVVANAGIAASDGITELGEERFRAVVDVNLTGTWLTVRSAAHVLRSQGTGGNIVLIGSKNVMDPGAAFSAYSSSKAGAHQVAKVAALELAKDGIRVNIVAPDAVFAEGDIPSGLWTEIGPARARARGLEAWELPEFYRKRNLLTAAVTARHVADAVVFFASDLTPTTGATLPVDGGLPGAFPR